MKKLFFLSMLILFSFCSEKESVIKTANLSELESGHVVIFKPNDSNILKINKTVNDNRNKFFVNELINKYELFDFESGQRTFSYQIPNDGPEAMKGGMNGSSVLSSSTYAVFNQSGYFHLYENGKLHHSQKIPISKISKDRFIQISKESGNLIQTGKGTYQIIFNPFELMTAKGGFDTEFRSWIMELDLENGIQCISDFKSPFDESYSDSPTATLSLGVENTQNQEFWYMFASSDSIFQIQDCNVVQKFKLNGQNFTYFPDLVKRNGRSAQWNPNPKSHRNIKLLYDNNIEKYLRIVGLPKNLSEDELQAMDVRNSSKLEKDYQILIYDRNWTLEAILNFKIPDDNSLESCFVDDGIFYMNQPNQKSEDEYVLIKHDLKNFLNL